MGCHHCGTTERDLRPYGPGGADVCHPCATETPERLAQTKAAYDALDTAARAASPTHTTVLTDRGPAPVDGRTLCARIVAAPPGDRAPVQVKTWVCGRPLPCSVHG